jgi:GH25 family lysozyme M1 (1,4-beta-N-acetylmuramidase)
MASSNLPFGIDVSRYQGTVNWDAVAASKNPEIVFCGIRAGISWGYTDPFFSRNWSEAKRASQARQDKGGFPLLRTAYLVLYFTEDPARMVDHFFSIVGNDLGELPLTIDVELDQGQGYKVISQKVHTVAQLITARAGRPPIIYSRYLWIDQFITGTTGSLWNTPPAWLNDYDWWLAQYLRTPEEHPGPPSLARGMNRERVIIQQTSDHGAPIGVQSLQMDYDRWQGDLTSLAKYVSVTPPPPPTPMTLEERIARLEKAAKDHGWTL